ncbi:uncharacterized protein Dvar_56830 [Desulfosarcina variabilis str. Montpellier]|uniref:hypothetical protein n=1 Tax=Desulfosarcina variabilis TaxID=2300 RepID=UPI003AFB2857
MGVLTALLIFASHDAFCEEEKPERRNVGAPEKWGIAMSIRSATIPFDAKKSVVNDIVPLIFYDTVACLSMASNSATGFFKVKTGR